MDIEMGQLRVKKPWARDDFRRLINQTYSAYYGKFKDQFNPDEYMQVVDDEQLVVRFAHFLEYQEENILTLGSMPQLDLGDIPTTHTFMRVESQQVYYLPRNQNPDHVYVQYSQLRPAYKSKNPKKRFETSSLPKKEVTFKEFQNTINLATTFMKNYRGKILMYDLMGYGLIAFGLLLIIIMGIGTSNSSSGKWGNMVLYILLYFIICPIIYKTSKCF